MSLDRDTLLICREALADRIHAARVDMTERGLTRALREHLQKKYEASEKAYYRVNQVLKMEEQEDEAS